MADFIPLNISWRSSEVGLWLADSKRDLAASFGRLREPCGFGTGWTGGEDG